MDEELMPALWHALRLMGLMHAKRWEKGIDPTCTHKTEKCYN